MGINIADILFFIIMLVFAVIGWRSGLMQMVFRLTSWLISMVLAWILYPILAELLQKTPLYMDIYHATQQHLGDTAAGTGLPEFWQTLLMQGEEAVSAGVAAYFAQLILNLISFLLVLIVVRLLIGFIKGALKMMSHLPVIGFFNHLGGLGLGLLEGFLAVCLLLAAAYSIVPLREDQGLQTTLEESAVADLMSQNNPLLKRLLPKDEIR